MNHHHNSYSSSSSWPASKKVTIINNLTTKTTTTTITKTKNLKKKNETRSEEFVHSFVRFVGSFFRLYIYKYIYAQIKRLYMTPNKNRIKQIEELENHKSKFCNRKSRFLLLFFLALSLSRFLIYCRLSWSIR